MSAQVSATELAMQICNRLGIHYIAFELKNPEVSSALYKSSLSRETKPASYWMSQDISCVSDPDDFTSSNPSAA